jgi:hypothetical protein
MVLPRELPPEKGYALLHSAFNFTDAQKANI